MRRLSLTQRITLLYGVVFAAVLLALGGFILRAVEHHFEEGDLQELYAKLDLARHVLAAAGEGDGDALASVPQQLDTALVGHHGLSIAVVRGDGEIIFASSGAPFPAEEIRGPAAGTDPRRPPARVWAREGELYRGIVADLPAAVPGAPPTRVVVSLDIGHHRAFMATFERSLWLAIVLAFVLSGLLGWLAARGALAPVLRMAAVARGISVQRLHERIDLDEVPRELTGLASEFNEMMARLEDAFGRLSEFSSDIAHELRTPVSNLMTQTQVALTRARSADAYREILHSNLEELDRLARMIADMLLLAKADNGLLPRPGETVNLADEARALAEFYEALAEERGVALVVRGSASVTGDRLMLRRALSNLVSNALRHTERGGTVTIEIAAGTDAATLAVSNPGEAIPAEHRARIFERFHRVDSARSRQAEGEGAGLGLAITRSIVLAHAGHIELDCDGGRTVFRMTLPAAATHDAAA